MKQIVVVLVLICLGLAGTVWADDEDFIKQTQNPLAHIISIPFQNNTYFNIGPFDRSENILNIQPVFPFLLGDACIVSRTIVPIVDQPNYISDTGSTTGLGDVNETIFFSPSIKWKVIFGVGPSVTFPTGSETTLTSGKYSGGPALVVLTQPEHWTLGFLVKNEWSFAGDELRNDVNNMLLQPFITYNIGAGWNIATAPQIIADWEAQLSEDQWLVPAGGGIGKLFYLGRLPINIGVQGYSFVVKPENIPCPDWTLRATLATYLPAF
jgi:hypothetical protein